MNTKEKNVNHDKCDIGPINEELENSVAKLLSENEHLCNEINHVKQVFKDQFDSIKHTRVRHKEQCDSLINKLNLKSVENEDLKAQIQDKVVQIVLWNDQIARYGDYQLGNVIISRVYYVERLRHNLFSIGQFCDADLEVPFRRAGYGTVDYLILTSGTLNKLAKDGLARGIPRLKFQKDHLCSACALGKSKKTYHQPKAEDTNQRKLYLLHMDLCAPMRMASINGKRYILVIVDDYSRFTWVRFLKTKDEASAAIIKCIKNIQVRLKAIVWNVRIDNGTEFVNQTLLEWYENVGISHQTSVARTPQQNGVVKRRSRTLVEAARTMLIFSKASLFLWAKAINTACYT
ncbi:retrovirus-related pol polyprotein from transposon TNT 1-94 [Tanacetum coccineum]